MIGSPCSLVDCRVVSHRYVYYARATTSGDFFVLPVHAEETYFPEVFGRSDSGRFQVFASE